MSDTWGPIAPRRTTAWRLARLVSAPVASARGGNWRSARVEVEYIDDGSLGWMRLGDLAKAMPQLAAVLADRYSDAALGAHQLEAALRLRNSGIPIAVEPGAGNQAFRPRTLFATWDAAGRDVVVAPVHAQRWLVAHACKHLNSTNAKTFGDAMRAVGLPEPADAVGLMRRWNGDILSAEAWPLIEIYSTLLAISLGRPGPIQADIRWRPRADVIKEAADEVVGELLAGAGRWSTRSEPGVDNLVCCTVKGLRAAAKGSGFGPKRWATLHPADANKTGERIEHIRRFAALDVRALIG